MGRWVDEEGGDVWMEYDDRDIWMGPKQDAATTTATDSPKENADADDRQAAKTSVTAMADNGNLANMYTPGSLMSVGVVVVVVVFVVVVVVVVVTTADHDILANILRDHLCR
jgi:hypothetical protein